METMRAFGLVSNVTKHLEPVVIPKKQLEEGDVEIRVMYCSICGSDIHNIENEWKRPMHYPLVPGHEVVGSVSEVGRLVTNFAVGDVVGLGPRCYSCQKDNCTFCQTGKDQHCPEAVSTYNAKYKSGEVSRGGYSESMRVSANHVFKIPAGIPHHQAPPLFCAGITVYTPLKRHAPKQAGEKRVGIVGLGGLGHLAVQFARALGYIVLAISTTASKQQDAMGFGANDFLVFDGISPVPPKFLGSLDLIVCTTHGKDLVLDKYLEMLKRVDGVLVLLDVPEAPVQFNGQLLTFPERRIEGSLIGSRRDIPEMLNFAAKHNIMPQVELSPMSEVNQALDRVRNGTARYRAVLEADFSWPHPAINSSITSSPGPSKESAPS